MVSMSESHRRSACQLELVAGSPTVLQKMRQAGQESHQLEPPCTTRNPTLGLQDGPTARSLRAPWGIT